MIETVHLQPGCYYHIYNRGNNRENIFIEDKNYEYFLQLWKRHISPVADTYAYSLLANHFHSLVKMKELEPENNSDNLIANPKSAWQKAFANFFNAYSKGFNKTYNRTGKLFEERFKRKQISNDAYFTQVIYYIHANPQRHGFINDFRHYPFSSYPSILSDGSTSLARQQVLDWFGGKKQFENYHSDVQQSLANQKEFEID
jgi:REP element-mobilizing transposase RayT